MTTSRPPISLGDGIRALATLKPTDPATAHEILALLGLEVRATAPPPVPDRPLESPTSPDEERPAPDRGLEPEHAPEHADDRAALGDEVPSALETLPSTAGAEIAGVEALQEERAPSLPPIDPLLLPRWVRGIVSAALSVPLPDGPPDVERLVGTLARGAPITDVPRRAVPTLRLGVHLLVDRSSRMTPFAKDQAWLDWALRRIVGEGRVERRGFTGSPLSAVTGADRSGRGGPRSPPPAGTPVLALTDLGIARPMFDPDANDPDDWRVLSR